MIATYLLIAVVTSLIIIGLLKIRLDAEERLSYEEKYEKLMQRYKECYKERNNLLDRLQDKEDKIRSKNQTIEQLSNKEINYKERIKELEDKLAQYDALGKQPIKSEYMFPVEKFTAETLVVSMEEVGTETSLPITLRDEKLMHRMLPSILPYVSIGREKTHYGMLAVAKLRVLKKVR